MGPEAAADPLNEYKKTFWGYFFVLHSGHIEYVRFIYNS